MMEFGKHPKSIGFNQFLDRLIDKHAKRKLEYEKNMNEVSKRVEVLEKALPTPLISEVSENKFNVKKSNTTKPTIDDKFSLNETLRNSSLASQAFDSKEKHSNELKSSLLRDDNTNRPKSPIAEITNSFPTKIPTKIGKFKVQSRNEKTSIQQFTTENNSQTNNAKEIIQFKKIIDIIDKGVNEQILEEEIEREIKNFRDCPFLKGKRCGSPLQKETIVEEIESKENLNENHGAISIDFKVKDRMECEVEHFGNEKKKEKNILSMLIDGNEGYSLNISENEKDSREEVLIENVRWENNSEFSSKSNESLYKFTHTSSEGNLLKSSQQKQISLRDENYCENDTSSLETIVAHLLENNLKSSKLLKANVEAKITIEFKMETNELFPTFEPTFFLEKILAKSMVREQKFDGSIKAIESNEKKSNCKLETNNFDLETKEKSEEAPKNLSCLTIFNRPEIQKKSKNIFNELTENFFKLFINSSSSSKSKTKSVDLFNYNFITETFEVDFENDNIHLKPKITGKKNLHSSKLSTENEADSLDFSEKIKLESAESEKEVKKSTEVDMEVQNLLSENANSDSDINSVKLIDLSNNMERYAEGLPLKISKCTSCLPCQALYDMGTEMFPAKNEIQTQTPSKDSIKLESISQVANTQTEDDLLAFNLKDYEEIFVEELCDKNVEIEMELGNEYFEIEIETIKELQTEKCGQCFTKSKFNETSTQAEIRDLMPESFSTCSMCNCFVANSKGDFVRKDGKYFCLACFRKSMKSVPKQISKIWQNEDASLMKFQNIDFATYFCSTFPNQFKFPKDIVSKEPEKKNLVAGGDSDSEYHKNCQTIHEEEVKQIENLTNEKVVEVKISEDTISDAKVTNQDVLFDVVKDPKSEEKLNIIEMNWSEEEINIEIIKSDDTKTEKLACETAISTEKNQENDHSKFCESSSCQCKKCIFISPIVPCKSVTFKSNINLTQEQIDVEKQWELFTLIERADPKARIRIRGNLQKILSICHIGSHNEKIIENAIKILDEKIVENAKEKKKVSGKESFISLPNNVSLECLKRTSSKKSQAFFDHRMLNNKKQCTCPLCASESYNDIVF